jgi:hypothetical protein
LARPDRRLKWEIAHERLLPLFSIILPPVKRKQEKWAVLTAKIIVANI